MRKEARLARNAAPRKEGSVDAKPLRRAFRKTARGGWRRAGVHVAAGVEDVSSETVVLCGGGISGMATAKALSLVGVPSVVLERDGSRGRREGTAIALWVNAFRALDALGVGDVLRMEYDNLEVFKLCNRDGTVLKQFRLEECDGGPHEFRGVRRSKLLEALGEGLPPGSVQYDTAVKKVRNLDGSAEIELEDGRKFPCRAVIGCDGARSCVADALGIPPPMYSGYQAYRGVARFDDGIPFEKAVYQVWHLGESSGTRFGMYPMNGKDVYWFVCFNASSRIAKITQEEQKMHAMQLVDGWKLHAIDVVKSTHPDTIVRSKIGDRLQPWPFRDSWGNGYISLAGDAAHPMTPNLGQGGCCALEDAIVLARKLSSSRPGLSTVNALREYEKERIERTAGITLRSRIFGSLLQLPSWPVALVRDAAVSTLFQPTHFLDHTMYDCGELPWSSKQ